MADSAGAEKVPLGRGVGGEGGGGIQQDAVGNRDAREGVLPYTNRTMRGRNVVVELRNLRRCESTETVSVPFPNECGEFPQRTLESIPHA